MKTRLVVLSLAALIGLSLGILPVLAAPTASETVISGTLDNLLITATETVTSTKVNVDGTLLDLPWQEGNGVVTATVNTLTDWPNGYGCFKVENGDLEPTVNPESDFVNWEGGDGWVCKKPAPTTRVEGSLAELKLTITDSGADTQANIDGELTPVQWTTFDGRTLTAIINTLTDWPNGYGCFKVENGVVPSVDPGSDFVAFTDDPTWVCRKPEVTTTISGTLTELTVTVTGSPADTMVNVDGLLWDIPWQGTEPMTATFDTLTEWGQSWLCFKIENVVIPVIDPESDFVAYSGDPTWVCRKPYTVYLPITFQK
jgi:hypothetical protein